MLYLSKASVRMSKYNRNGQKQEWYDGPIYICTEDYRCADGIIEECKRRKLYHKHIPTVIDYTPYDHSVCSAPMSKVAIYEKGWKLERLVDWAITTYNFKEMYLHPYDPRAYSVWIQPCKEVDISGDSYDEDGDPRPLARHWRMDPR